MLVKSVEELIGSTPLLEIEYLSLNECRILGKLEYLNPASSIKDRVALKMIDDAVRSGKIGKDTVVIEPTSGNTGIGLAMVCAVRGVKLILTMPSSMSLERRKLLKHLGAEIELTPAKDGMDGAIKRALELRKDYKDAFIPNQFGNLNNPLIHEETTATEILYDTDSKIDIFVASIGTGGTITGVAKVLKREIEGIKIVGIEPENSPIITKGVKGSHKIEGIGAGFIPDILNLELLDEVRRVSEEDAISYARSASKRAGLLCGISSGANLSVAHRLAKESRGKTIVTVLPDTAQRYLSTELFD
jgi:cysteine synthase A